MFDRVMVANRGEIAVRILRTCRRLGIATVAVYSDADARAPHVLAADRAVHLGGSAPAESYLNIDRLIDAARATGAQAVHPGYGFLSEQPELARACAAAGLTFVGPPPAALELLGNKTASRALMAQHGVPLIPGTEAQDWTPKTLAAAARNLGFPVLLKASAGGGGKGMRAVHAEETLWADYQAAQREAAAAFGDGTLYLEKLLERPRHIEVQILADTHGACVHLGERECSIQRRHQKIIEESPSCALDDPLRAAMCATAVEVASAAGYQNAGTVEFLLDSDGSYYFLEVNARLQVEHPATELVTGIDIVAEQLRIAAKEELGREQRDLGPRGHAIECRVYAEDPANGFLPHPGRLLLYAEPTGPGVRVDSGVCEGFDVPLEYDPILAKLICFGETREEARTRAVAALGDYTVLGVKTPIPMMRDILRHPEFIAGNLHTGFLAQHFPNWSPDPTALPLAVAAAVATNRSTHAGRPVAEMGPPTPWQTLGGWRLGGES